MMDVLREKFPSSTQSPFVVETGPFQESAENRLEMHYELELGIMVTGRAKRYYNDYEMEVGPGQIWLCGIWEPHSRRTLKQPCDRIFMSILPQTLASLRFWPVADANLLAPFLVPPRYRPQIAHADEQTVIQLGQRIGRIREQNHVEHRNFWYLLLLAEVLLLATRDWRPPKSVSDPSATEAFFKITKAIHQVLDSRRRISEKEAANICQISQYSFGALFENLMGMSFTQFDLRFRIDMAAWYLVNTDEQIKNIAMQWGFTDSSHFNRYFRDHYGSSPQEYRQRFSRMTPPHEKSLKPAPAASAPKKRKNPGQNPFA
jgi:AraC-like DNA-binding protein